MVLIKVKFIVNLIVEKLGKCEKNFIKNFKFLFLIRKTV